METAIDYTDATKETRERALSDLGLSLESVFIPFSKSRHAKPEKGEKVWECLNWRVTLKRGDRKILETDYSQGVAHAPAYKNPPKFPSGKVDPYKQKQVVAWEIEHGKRARIMDSIDWISGKDPIPGPTLLEVCYSLAMDAQSGQESFEDFCSNFGYDTDSRKAEATWRSCADIYRALGPSLLESVSRIVEGY